MKITWYGHACFKLNVSSLKILIDPHDGVSIGLPRPNITERIDLVLITHEHFDHNAREIVPNKDAVFLSMFRGEKKFNEVRVKGVETFHDKVKGKQRGRNTVYLIEAEGLKLAHLGDLGEVLREDKVNEIGDVDVLLAPIGGVFTINGEEAWRIALSLNAKVLIPMHYAIPGLNLPIAGLESLVKGKSYKEVKSNSIDVKPLELPSELTIMVLSPP